MIQKVCVSLASYLWLLYGPSDGNIYRYVTHSFNMYTDFLCCHIFGQRK